MSMRKGFTNIAQLLVSGDDERRIGAMNIAIVLSQYSE
jgi:hypothetical protein